MDPIYNVLWSYNLSNHEVNCYNIIATELCSRNATDKSITNEFRHFTMAHTMKSEFKSPNFNLLSVLTPELTLPVIPDCFVTRLQAAINLLCCLDTLTIANNLQMTAIKDDNDDRRLVTSKQFTRDDFQSVNRFESHGGGWGYSGHSIEAIRFMTDTDILLGKL